MASLPPVARNIFVFCKKCDKDRYFKVITHTSSTSAKLQCEVCKCHRNYSIEEKNQYVPTGARKATTPKLTSSKSKTASAWVLLKEQYRGPEAVNYAMSQKYTDKQCLIHPTFGVGFVTKSLPNKIEVVFSEGVKELLHDRK